MIRRLALVSAVVAAMSANALALDLGVNVHGGGTATANDQIATVMKQRNLKTARLDLMSGADQTALRDQVQKIRANGGRVEVSLQIPFQWDHSCNPNLTYIEQDAYNQTVTGVNQVKDIVQDFELLNETPLRSEILNEVPFNSAGTSTTPYEGKPCVATLTAALRGMSRAIRDVRASSGLPLRTILGAVGRDFGFLTFMQQNGVLFDVVGWHVYPRYAESSLLSDPWYGSGGPLTRLAVFGKPVHINEFDCGEIYDSTYENRMGATYTETCLKALNKHLTDLRSQTIVNLESVHMYELLDEPSKAVPENRFGMMFDLANPKVHLYLVTAFAGGTLSATERYAITSRGLLTDAQIDAMQVTATPSTESIQGSSITTTGTIVDATGATWTLSGGVVYRNGVATVSSSVVLLLYWNHTVYQQNSYGGWWDWVNGGWQATTDPRLASTSTSTTTTTTTTTTTPADTQAPTVSITSPANGSAFPRRATITAAASATDNVKVTEVRFYLGGSMRCAVTSAPYACQMTLPTKRGWTGTLDVQASDAAGNVGRSSITVSTQ
jgi:hypothetical protein